MKTAIYIENGIVQLVLTPENDFEKNALGSFKHKPLDATIEMGGFYHCAGGWVRHLRHPSEEDNSLIIKLGQESAVNGT